MTENKKTLRKERDTGFRLPGWSLNFSKFVFVGGFVFCWGIGFNFTLVSLLRMPVLLAYALVLCSQAVIGYTTNRYYVFDGRERSAVKTGIGYGILFATFRVVDWTLYSVAVKWLGIPYLVAQIGNNVLFFLMKFVAYRLLFEGRGSKKTYKQGADVTAHA